MKSPLAQKKFSSREKKIFILACLFLLAYAYYLAVFVPLKQKREDILSQILAQEKEFKKNLKIIESSKTFDVKYQSVWASFKQKASDEQIMSSILSEVESAAERLNVLVTNKKPQRSRKVDFYNNFVVDLSLEGDMNQIVHFIFDMQNPPHMFYIDEMSLNMKSSKDTTIKCRLLLSRALIP